MRKTRLFDVLMAVLLTASALYIRFFKANEAAMCMAGERTVFMHGLTLEDLAQTLYGAVSGGR